MNWSNISHDVFRRYSMYLQKWEESNFGNVATWQDSRKGKSSVRPVFVYEKGTQTGLFRRCTRCLKKTCGKTLDDSVTILKRLRNARSSAAALMSDECRRKRRTLGHDRMLGYSDGTSYHIFFSFFFACIERTAMAHHAFNWFLKCAESHFGRVATWLNLRKWKYFLNEKFSYMYAKNKHQWQNGAKKRDFGRKPRSVRTH